MEFDQDNKVIQLCAKGMEWEGQGRLAEASRFYFTMPGMQQPPAWRNVPPHIVWLGTRKIFQTN